MAYTVGRHVVFGAGQHSPWTSAGQRLLAHELAHVADSSSEPAIRRKEAVKESELIPTPGEVAVPEPVNEPVNLGYPWQIEEIRNKVYPFRDEALSEFLRIYAEIDIDTGDLPTEEVTPSAIREERARLQAEIKAAHAAVKSNPGNLELVAREERFKNLLSYLPEPTKDLKLPASAIKKWTAYRYSSKGPAGEDLAHDALLKRILDRFDTDPGFVRYPKWVRYMVLHFSGMRYASARKSYAPPTALLKKLKIEELTRTSSLSPDTDIEISAASARKQIEAELATAGRTRAGRLRERLTRLTAVETAKKAAFPQKQDEAKLAALEEMLGLERELERIDSELGPMETAGFSGRPTEPSRESDAPRLRAREKVIGARIAELTEIVGAKRLKDVRKNIEAAEITRRNAVLEDKIERALAVLDSLDDSKALALLKEMRVRKAFPDWVWREIVRSTPLRLEEVDTNWEQVTAEEKAAKGKNDPITKHWKTIMSDWIREESAWRDKHKGDLSLVTIRAVCDQIAEMAQYARGVQPKPGIGQKALWYAKGDKGTKFFRPTKPADLAPGTSLFWAEWQNQPPDDDVKKIPTNLFSDLRTDTNVTIHDGLKDANGCIYHVGSDHLVSRDCPIGTPATPSDLTPVLVQWLNWKHEATVVEVDEKHGRVITFETGPIGIRFWPLKDKVYGVLDHWRVYAGFAPSAAEHKDIDPYLKGILPGR